MLMASCGMPGKYAMRRGVDGTNLFFAFLPIDLILKQKCS